MSDLAMRLGGLLSRGRESNSLVGASSVPARIRMPRILFVATAVALLVFGFLMIYSSSSIACLTSKDCNFDPTFYLVRQLMFAGAGIVLCVVLSRLDYHTWRGTPLKVVWGLTLVALVLVYTPLAGVDANGASRWIAMGPFKLQPSEFAKVTIMLVGARIAEEYYAQATLSTKEALGLLAGGVFAPLLLILLQPDKGTCGVLLLTLLVMCYLSGVSGRMILGIAACLLVVALVYALKDDYSRARILTMLDPFRDAFESGYQLTQGFYAFGSGGLTGVGIGMSRQKYNYLPMAHNDFVFAIVGEELGFVGAVAMIAAFGLLLWAGLKVAENASDLSGRLIAAGCTSLIIIQLLLNLTGVVGIFPLSGKPVPFVSYGGSSIICSCMLVGLVTSVSLRSTLPETSHELRRRDLRLAEEEEDSGVGEAQPRSARLAGGTGFREGSVVQGQPARPTWGAGTAWGSGVAREATRSSSSRSDLRLVSGGGARTDSKRDASSYAASALGTTRTPTRSSAGAGYGRVDLDRESAHDRLRK